MVTSGLANNTGAISIGHDPIKHELTKHIGDNASFVCAVVQDQVTVPHHVPSELQLVDFFTSHSRAQHGFYLSKLVLRIHPDFEGGC